MPISRDGGVDGWIVFGGPARAGPGDGGGGRDARGGGAAVRGRPLDRLPLGGGGAHGRTAGRQAGGRRPEAADHGPGGGGVAGALREANHLTLAECRDRLAERTGVRCTRGRWAGRCGGAAGRERSAACTRPSRAARTWPPRAPRGRRTPRRGWAGSRRSGWCSWTSVAC